MGYHSDVMKKESLTCGLAVLSAITALADFQSPRDLAMHLEKQQARFEGLWLPTTNIGFLPA